MKSTIDSLKTTYDNNYNANDPLSEQAMEASAYGLLEFEYELIDNLISAVTNKGLDGSNGITQDELEGFLDAISAAGPSFALGDNLDDIAGFDYQVDINTEIPDVTL